MVMNLVNVLHRLTTRGIKVLWFNPAAGNSVPDSRSLTPSPQRDGEERGTPGRARGRDKV